MGFMDKAKKLAEQAQQKLDETQKKLQPESSSTQGQPQGGGVKLRRARPSGPGRAARRPRQRRRPAEPAAPAGRRPRRRPRPPEPTPTEQPGRRRARAAPGTARPASANATPDPFKPIQ